MAVQHLLIRICMQELARGCRCNVLTWHACVRGHERPQPSTVTGQTRWEAAKLIYNFCWKNSCSARCQLTSSWTDIHPLLNLVWPLQPAFTRGIQGVSTSPCRLTQSKIPVLHVLMQHVYDLIASCCVLIGPWLKGKGKALWSMVKNRCSVGDRIPQISASLQVWKWAYFRITGRELAGPISAPVYAPTTTYHQQSLPPPPSLPLSLTLLLSRSLSCSPAACRA